MCVKIQCTCQVPTRPLCLLAVILDSEDFKHFHHEQYQSERVYNILVVVFLFSCKKLLAKFHQYLAIFRNIFDWLLQPVKICRSSVAVLKTSADLWLFSKPY